jgi:MFS family permease
MASTARVQIRLDEHPPPPPGGGVFHGWWIVGGVFAIYFVSGGLFNTATIYFKALIAEFGWNRTELSGVFSMGFLVAGVSSPIWGRIADRRGPRASFIPGVLLTGCLCLALSQVWSLPSLYFIYLLFTFSFAGISLIPISVILSNWFVQRRGRAIGIAYTGVGFGTLLLTPVVGLLVASVGWRAAYVVSGVVLLALLTPVALWFTNRPEDIGLTPDGLPRIGADVVPDATQASRLDAAGLRLADAVKTPAFWLVALTWLVTMMPLSAISLHQVPYLTDLGISTELASVVVGLVGGLSILGRIAAGTLSERFSIQRIYAVCYVLMSLGIASLAAATSTGPTALAPYVLCFGIAVGGCFALTALLVGDLFGGRALGEIFGMLGLAATVGGAAGGVGAGMLFDAFGSYDAVFALGIGLSLLGALLILFVRRPPMLAAAS